jgi:hypothetical protein
MFVRSEVGGVVLDDRVMSGGVGSCRATRRLGQRAFGQRSVAAGLPAAARRARTDDPVTPMAIAMAT